MNSNLSDIITSAYGAWVISAGLVAELQFIPIYAAAAHIMHE